MIFLLFHLKRHTLVIKRFEVIFQNIADESKIIEELYVVEVVVKSWTNDILFSTSKGEVYIKTEGGKKKLDAYGIQEELRGRLNGF